MALQQAEEAFIELQLTANLQYKSLVDCVTKIDQEVDKMREDALENQATLLKVVGVTLVFDAHGSTPKDKYWALHDQIHWPQLLVVKLLEYDAFPPEVENLFKKMADLHKAYLAFQDKKKFVEQTLKNMSDNPWLHDPERAKKSVEELRKTITDLRNEIDKKDGKRPAPHDEAASDGAVINEGNAALCFGLKTHGEGPSQSKKRLASQAPHGEGSSKHTKINGDKNKLPAPHGEGSSPRTMRSGPCKNDVFDEIPDMIVICSVDLTIDDSE